MTVKIANDEARIQSLRDLQLLDTLPQDMFDRVTSLTKDLLGCEMALITLVEDERQWFLSKQGVEETETPRDQSFCAHAIAEKQALLVRDASTDERFLANELVTGPKHLRSYIGVPVAAPDGQLIGALCALDQTVGKFDEGDTQTIRELASVVEDLIKIHKIERERSALADDLRERKSILQQVGRIFLQAEDSAKIGAWEVNIADRSMYMSDGVYKILGVPNYTKFDVEKALGFYIDEDRPRAHAELNRAIKTKQPFRFEASIRDANGTMKRLVAKGEYFDADSARPARVAGIIRDDSESYEQKVELEKAANFDSLTGLYNRHAFDRILGTRLGAKGRLAGQVGLVLIDLDGFKEINDTFGHLAGDAVLERVAKKIKRVAPANAVVARWGGDEFAVIAPPNATEAQLHGMAEKMLEAVQDEIVISERRVAMNATCGITIADNQSDSRELVRRVDLALYHGKRSSQGLIHFYSEEIEAEHRAKHEAIATVRRALDDERVFAAYQPIVYLENPRVIGLEALMRLHDEQGRVIAAQSVMPAILYPALSKEIGERMIGFIAEDFLAAKDSLPLSGFISLNVTEGDLLSVNYVNSLKATLKRAHIKPTQVMLEVTESILMVNDPVETANVLGELQSLGVKIALDDFGTGYSSLSHLRDFPIDIVKIDGSFIASLCHEEQSRLIVQALIGMARNLNIRVIAEGVENEAQRQLLLEMGCKYGQGYLFGAAAPVDQLKQILFEKPKVLVK